MSSKLKVGEDAIPRFITLSVVGWIDASTGEDVPLFVNVIKN